jgi:hypothetical protein
MLYSAVQLTGQLDCCRRSTALSASDMSRLDLTEKLYRSVYSAFTV